MKRNNHFVAAKKGTIMLITISIFLAFCFMSCKTIYVIVPTKDSNYYFDSTHKWVDWNIWFPANTTSNERNNYVDILRQSIIQYVIDWNTNHGTNYPVIVEPVHCPCDSLLYNLNATLPFGASGVTASPPPPPGNGQGGSGEVVNLNNSFTIDSVTSNMDKADTTQVVLKMAAIDPSKILAVMDTGLDSTLFQNQFKDLLWTAPNKNRTLRNFLFFSNFRNYEYYADDDKYKHGTAVTALALEALQRSAPASNKLPKVMVLKVLDQNRKGSTFTVSCALSYAAQNNANVINASLGYYGEEDSILKHYVEICGQAASGSIPILAAAGNMPGVHDPTMLCDPPTNANELGDRRKFFPGCLSIKYPNVICVTGLQTETKSCFYQNYSSSLVSVGVVTNPKSKCCAFPVNFLKSGYEGSSFATPIVSGEMINYIMQAPGNIWQNCLNVISTPTTNAAARSLRYISP